MKPQDHMTPEKLERYSFLWSEARLAVAALALFLGGIPPVVYFLGYNSSIWGVLRIAWILSGVASAYMGYRWYSNGMKVFGGKDQKDTGAFLVSVVSGINLGWTGLSGNNVGMSIASGKLIFLLAGALYLVAGMHLWKRWKASQESIF